MASGTGYYDYNTQIYTALSQETWATIEDSATAQWDDWKTWDGTPNTSVEYTTDVYDYGKTDWVNCILDFEPTLPASTVIKYGTTLDSAGDLTESHIDSPTSYSVVPGQDPVTGLYGRYFQFVITVAQDSGTQGTPALTLPTVRLTNESRTITQSDIDTSALGGSVGARELSFNVSTGKITNIITQAHLTGYDDSAGNPRTPVVYVDKASSPMVLNIFDLDTYGKRTRIDCTVDIQAQTMPLLRATGSGTIEEVID